MGEFGGAGNVSLLEKMWKNWPMKCRQPRADSVTGSVNRY